MYISLHFLIVFLKLMVLLLCNDSFLTLADSVITLKISENIERGTKICNLFDVIIPRPSKTTIFQLTKNHFFSLEASDVVVIARIDRDSNSELCRYKFGNFTCVWRSLLFSSMGVVYTLKIVILDENDNAPTWTTEHFQLKVSEDAKPDEFELELPRAEDPDEYPNDIVKYSIDPPSKYFLIKSMKIKSIIKPILKLKVPIDRELLPWHNITLKVIDGGSPALYGLLNLYIEISDINDNTPTFESSVYVQTIPRNIKLNQTIDLGIKAVDLDEGLNGKISYSFPLNVPFYIPQCFKIDKTSAILSIRRSLVTNDCYQSKYIFNIQAYDNGSPTKSSGTQIVLHVKEENRYPPEIFFFNGGSQFELKENNPINKIIGSGIVKDKDSEKIHCFLDGHYRFNFSLRMNATKTKNIIVFDLVTHSIFDRELHSRLLVNMTCQDFGSPPLITTKTIAIFITDDNDNSPRFSQNVYHIKIFEQNPPNQKIAQVSAYDNDEGMNSLLIYQIRSSSPLPDIKMIEINSQGDIRALMPLDRESTPNGFQFQVIATDQGHPPRSASVDVLIELLDINDNTPVFLQSIYNFSFKEDFGTNAVLRNVGFVRATDRDIQENSELSYSIANSYSLPFKLNNVSGELSSYSLVDRENHRTMYSFVAVVMDNPSNLLYRRTASVSVFIHIEDVNDNPPVFVHPTDKSYRVHLSYQSPVGSLVTKVKATDKDVGFNSAIHYSLIDPERNILFSINESSGEIVTSTVLNIIHKGTENIFVKATDSGTPPLVAIQRLNIIIGDFRSPFSPNPDYDEQPFLSDHATFIIVGIVLGTFCVCCALITGICTMTYRRWRSNHSRTADRRHYETDEFRDLQFNEDCIVMKEII